MPETLNSNSSTAKKKERQRSISDNLMKTVSAFVGKCDSILEKEYICFQSHIPLKKKTQIVSQEENVTDYMLHV
jgi:hypothetical protein